MTTFWAYGQYGSGLIYFSQVESKFASVSIRARGNLSVDETNALVREVEEQVLEIEGIEHGARTQLSGQPSRSGGTDRIGSMFVELYDEPLRRNSATEILEEIRRRSADISGIQVEAWAEDMGSGQYYKHRVVILQSQSV